MSKVVLCGVLLCFASVFAQFGFQFPQDSPNTHPGIQNLGRKAISFFPQSINRITSAFGGIRSKLRSTEAPTSTTTKTITTTTTTTEKNYLEGGHRQKPLESNKALSIMTFNMTSNSVCSLVQCFPILLILAQKNQMCLETHLVYRPPEPTKPPVSYDVALNTLLHALANRPQGHDHYDPHDDHHHQPHPYPHGHETPYYVYGTSHGQGYGVPYYGKDIREVKTYVNNKGFGASTLKIYPVGAKTSGYGETYASGVKVYAGGAYNSPGVKVYTEGKGQRVGYGQTYAPGTKVYPVTRNKFKMVFNNKRRKSAKLLSESEEPEDSCVAIDGRNGACISIRSCQSLLIILQNVRTNPNAVNVLRRSHCGFEGNDPKVCCPAAEPEPQTPEPPPPSPWENSNVKMPDSGTDAGGGDSASNGDSGSSFVDALPDPPECGYSNATLSRVVGGVPAKLGDFPWMALLGYHSARFPGQPRWLCGGSLVTAKHVLTAAHCIHGREEDLYQVRLGELDVSRDDDGATPIDVPIIRKIKHEEYSAKAFTNDIGVLLLARSVTFTHLIRPICLPRTAELRALTFERYTPIIAGWGDTEFRGPSAPHLQALQLPVVSNAFCSNAYRAYKQQVIDERVLCAGYEKGGRDACQGDSGGPLMQPIYNTETYKTFIYQIGVVSFGRKCAEAGFPGVYSRTTHFMPWLHAQLVGPSNL